MEHAVEVRNLVVQRGTQRGAARPELHRSPRAPSPACSGPSGSGKTTLMRCIVGVQKIKSGTVTVFGEPAGSPPLRRRIGYLTQAPSVYADLTVRENARYFASLYGVGAGAAPTRPSPTSGWPRPAGQLVGTLSGGQRARASLACALVSEPELLVLDEPTVGQDPVLRNELWDQFRALAAAGTTIIVSSHVMDEASRCDRLLLIRAGDLIADDTPGRRAGRRRHRRPGRGVPAPRAGPRRAEGGSALMSPRLTLATAARILRQLRHDRRTIAMIIVVPTVLLTLLRYLFDSQPAVFDRIGLIMLGVFPFVIMFLLTSVAMLRERTSGTLERLLTTPIGKADILFGYGLAFARRRGGAGRGRLRAGVLAARPGHAGRASGWSSCIAIGNAVLGVALGLFFSAFANSEFQAVQFMPAVRAAAGCCCAGCSRRATRWPAGCRRSATCCRCRTRWRRCRRWVRNVEPTGTMWRDLGIIVGCIVVALLAGAATLRRRTA